MRCRPSPAMSQTYLRCRFRPCFWPTFSAFQARLTRPIKRLIARAGVRLTTPPTVNVENLEYSPDNFLLQVLKSALPSRVASLLYLANDQGTPIADSRTEALFLWL
jgi:hypothetical protein